MFVSIRHQATLPGHDHQKHEEIFHIRSSGKSRDIYLAKWLLGKTLNGEWKEAKKMRISHVIL